MAEEKKQTPAEAGKTEETQPSLLDQILEETRIRPSDEGYDAARRGVQAFLAELLTPEREGVKIQVGVVNEMIAEIDRKLSAQVDAILHHPEFQQLESAWTGLKFVVDRTNFRENCKIELLNVSQKDLLQDFEDSPEVTKSGLYKHAYT